MKFWGLQNLATCKFLRLQNFAGCEISQTCEILQVANFPNLLNFAGCQFSQPTKFCRLRIFPTCEISQLANFRNLQNFASCQFSQHANTPHLCTCACLLLFNLPFWLFYTSLHPCIFSSLTHFYNFLLLSTYISSTMFVIKSTFCHLINQSGTKLPPLYY